MTTVSLEENDIVCPLIKYQYEDMQRAVHITYQHIRLLAVSCFDFNANSSR